MNERKEERKKGRKEERKKGRKNERETKNIEITFFSSGMFNIIAAVWNISNLRQYFESPKFIRAL